LQLYVDKNTDLMRATFIAVGLAELLYQIPPPNSGQQVTITDQGSCYVISSHLSADELTAIVGQRGYLPALLPAISKPLTGKERRRVEAGESEAEMLLKYVPRGFSGEHVKYGEHKQAFEIFRKYRPPKDGNRDEDAPQPPHPDFPVWAHLCSYFGKGSAMRVGYPAVVHAWHAHQGDAASALWDLITYCYGDFPNAVDEAQIGWQTHLRDALQYADYPLQTTVSALAVVSPSTSKGVSAEAGFNRLVEDTPGAFWLEMYFGFAGFLQVGMPYTIGSDVLTFYPLPRQITRQGLHDIMRHHRASGTAQRLYTYSNGLPRAKLDVLSHLTFYQNMVAHYLAAIDDGTLPPGVTLDAVSGLVGYYYKNISTQIPFDETTFALPPWLPRQPDEGMLSEAKRLLEDHRKLIEMIRGRPPKYAMTADEMHLIEQYRRYLTRGSAEDWIQFAIACGLYRFRNMADMRTPTLSLTLFKESFPMTQSTSDRADYRPILDNPGFKKIADAISYCTGYSRYIRDVQNDRTFPFKVRHGLGDDLLRNAHNPELFMLDLSRFVHDYRRESMNVQANTGKTRTEIEPQDLHEVTGLVATHGSRIVAHLLVASGYAARFGRDGQNS